MDNTDVRNIRLMTEKQMAEYLQVSTKTVRNMAAAGVIGKYQPLGKNHTARYYMKGE